MNQAKADMIENTMGEVETWMVERAGEPPLNLRMVTVQEVIDAMPKRLERTARLHNVVGSVLRRKFRGEKLGQQRVGHNKPVLWAINGSAALLKNTTHIGELYLKERANSVKSAEATAAEDFE